MSIQNNEAPAPADATEASAAVGGAPAAVAGVAADEATALGAAESGGEGVVPAADADAVVADDGVADGAAPAADPVDAAPYEGLIAPEGTTLAAEDMALAAPLMRELGIEDGEAAQGFINNAAPVINQIIERTTERMTLQMAENRAEMVRGWGEELRADAEVGGANYDRSIADAALARDKLFPETFRTFLNESGLGNHPDMVRGLAAAGRQMRDDTIHGINHQSPAAKPGDNLYDPAYSPKG